MAWQPSDEYFSFDIESIKRNAPTISGVYGLYNFNYQIIIGETANIRLALQGHLNEAQHYHEIHRPTGFTFEICDAESRKEKARQLIAEYKPVLQEYRPPILSPKMVESSTPVRPTWLPDYQPPILSPNLVEPDAVVEPSTPPRPAAQWEAPTRTYPDSSLLSGRKKPEPYYFNRNQVAVLTSGFAACLVIVFTLGFFAGKSFQRSAIIGSVSPAIQAPVSTPLLTQDSPEPTMSHEPVPEPELKAVPLAKSTVVKPAPAPAVDEKVASVPAVKGEDIIPQAAQSKPPAPVVPAVPTASSEPKNGWAVQIRSSVDRKLTDSLVEQLKARGLEPYVTEGVINGQTWYRVRLGSFEHQGEAEALRQKMASDSEFRNAFVTK